jgi:hypothetical protein
MIWFILTDPAWPYVAYWGVRVKLPTLRTSLYHHLNSILVHNLETEFKEGFCNRVPYVRPYGVTPDRKRIVNRPRTATHEEVISDKSIFIYILKLLRSYTFIMYVSCFNIIYNCIFIDMFALFCILFANWHSPSTLTEVFPCFSFTCKANARVYLAKTRHGPHSS